MSKIQLIFDPSDTVTGVDPDYARQRGIKSVMLDVDPTFMKWGPTDMADFLAKLISLFFAAMRDRSGDPQ